MFIKLADGTRFSVSHITGYCSADAVGGGSWIHLVSAPTQPQHVDETPDEIDALIHQALRIEAHVRALVPICRVCGCTENNACEDPIDGNCSWVEPDLCSACLDGAERDLIRNNMAPSPLAAAMDLASVPDAPTQTGTSVPDRNDCPDCHGKGTIITCPDDMCRSADECMHGDGEAPCPTCHGGDL